MDPSENWLGRSASVNRSVDGVLPLKPLVQRGQLGTSFALSSGIPQVPNDANLIGDRLPSTDLAEDIISDIVIVSNLKVY